MKASLVLAAACCGLMLSGCATTEAVKRAQATADQALTLAQQGNVAAQKAQGTADSAVAAAAQAQSTADLGVAKADAAAASAQAAGEAAAKADRTFWQHHERHHRHRSHK